MSDRYIIRYRGEWVVVFDTTTNKALARFYGWDEGHREACDYIASL